MQTELYSPENFNSIQQQVIELLGWNAETHNEHIYETALEYLEHYVKDESAIIISQLTSTKIFWNWWRLNWYAREQSFIEGMIVPLSKKYTLAIYAMLHNAQLLAEELYPNGIVLSETYASMIDLVNKKEVAA